MPYAFCEQTGKDIKDISDEVPFDIPESWEWVRLSEIVLKITDGTHHSPPNSEHGDYMYITAKNIKDEGVSLQNITYVDARIHNEIYSRCNPHFGDVLLIKDGATTGIVTVNNIVEPFSMLSSVALLKIPENLSAWYLVYVIRSDLFYKSIRSKMKGTGITRITLKQIDPILIPLPPLAEQKRIVAKIEELLPYIEQYDRAETQLTTLNTTFPEMLKKSILQEAVQGKLVPQDPTDEPASVLLERIRAEKQELIRQGKIKKDKHESVIFTHDKIPYEKRDGLERCIADEVPFDIPDNWCWCRLKEIVSILGDGIHGTPIYDENGEYYFINGNNLREGKIIIKSDTKRVNDTGYQKYKKELNANTVFVSINGTLGNIAFYNNEKIILGKSACYFNLIDAGLKQYMYYLLKTDYYIKYAKREATGSTIKNVSLKTMNDFLVPLPPLAEQHRIVEKINELMPVINSISQ